MTKRSLQPEKSQDTEVLTDRRVESTPDPNFGPATHLTPVPGLVHEGRPAQPHRGRPSRSSADGSTVDSAQPGWPASGQPRTAALSILQRVAADRAGDTTMPVIQRLDGRRGLPDALRAGVEALSRVSLDDVTVHYDSPKPAGLGALAYTRGSEIFVGPGQERHLPHEAWHVVQQSRGPIAPTMYQRDTPINADERLEHEADVMGARASQLSSGLVADAPQSIRRLSLRGGPAGLVQRRETNPYATGDSHDGWELTAHHIIGHSKLVEAWSLLTPEQKAKIYALSIPKVLTVGLLSNAGVKVVVPQGLTEAEHLTNLRARLVDPEDNRTIHEIKIDDVRGSFYEWQHGNQFSGPNTSIRTEPTSSKDDMDFDGRYFSDDFAKLDAQGKALYKELEAGAKPGEGGLAKHQLLIFDRLTKILELTVDEANADFDPSQWTEITSLSVLEQLAANKELKRPHMLNYAFFRIPVIDTHMYGTVGVAKYEMLRATNPGNSAYTYAGSCALAPQAKGTSIFLPMQDSKKQVPTQAIEKPLTRVFADLNIAIRPLGAGYAVTVPKGLVAFNSGNGLRLEGYPKAMLAYSTNIGDVFTFSKAQVDDVIVKMDVPIGVSLYSYLKEQGAPVSSYLPKALYDEFKTFPDRLLGLQGRLSAAVIKEGKHTKEVNRLRQLKNPNPKEVERAKLRERQRDDARRDQVTYRVEMDRLKKLLATSSRL